MERNTELCSRIENELPLHVGGELDPNLARDVARHLEGCAACRALEARARAAHRAFATELNTVRGETAPDLWPGISAALRREGLVRPAAPSASPAAPILHRPQFAWGRIGLAAAAAVLALVGAWAARDWLQTARDDGRRDLVEEVDRGHHGREPIATQPVADGRLRPLNAGERSLQEGAATLGAGDELSPLLLPRSSRADEPAGLIQLHRVR